MLDKDAVRAALTGPVPSISTPFKQDGSVDYAGLRHYIDFLIAAKAKTILLTAGDSHYICLSDEEIAKITKVTCEQTAGRAMVVSADRYHSTDRAVAFAEYAVGVGVDVTMAMPCDWGASCTPETLAEHYAAVARVAPTMIVTNVFLPRGAAFGFETLELAFAKSDNIVAIKDDMCGTFAPKLCMMAHERCAIFAGGQKSNHMLMHPYGCDGYLSSFMSFVPSVTHEYWAAIEAGDLKAATAVIRDIDSPFFDFIMKLPGGFDAGMHGALELFGVAGRWRRRPYYSLNDQEMEQLSQFFRDKKLL